MNPLQDAVASPPTVEGLADTSPLHGLARRSLGPADALAQSVSAMAPVAAAVTMPAMVTAAAGRYAVASILCATVLVLLVGYTLGQYARRMGAAGSLYSYVAQALGSAGTWRPLVALATGCSLIIGYAGIAMFALIGLTVHASDFLASFGQPRLTSPAAAVVVLAVGGTCTWLLLRGLRLSSLAMLLAEAAALLVLAVPIVLVFLGIAGESGPDVGVRAAAPDPGFGGLATGAVLALMAFVGFESATVLGAETHRPLRTIPRVLVWSAAAGGVLYVAAALAQLTVLQSGYPMRPEEPQVFGPAMRAAGLPWLIPLLDVGAALSFFACVLACTTALARVLLTMGREGILPAWLGDAHPRFRTPAAAVLASMPLVTLGPAALMLLGVGTGEAMNKLIGTAATAYVAAYLLACCSAPVFLRRIGELTLRPALAAGLTSLALAGALVTYRITLAGQGRSASGWIYCALLAAALLWYLWHRRRGTAAPTLGLYDVPTQDAVLGGGRPAAGRAP